MANGQTLGAGALTSPTKPPAPQLAEDDPRKMAQDLADIQGNISIKIGQIFRAAKRDPALAANLRGATITLMKELAKTRDLRKEALRQAGLPTAKADIDFERVAAKIPEIPFITQTIKDEERLVGGPKGQPPEVVVPAVRTIPQGAVESTGGIAGVRGQPAPGPAPKIRAVIDSQTKKPTFASESQILANPDRFGPIPTGMKLRIGKDGSVEIATGGQDLTSTSVSDAERAKRQTTQVLAGISTLNNLFQESVKSGKPIIGALATFKGFLNKTVAQFVPGLFDKDRAKFERATKVLRQTSLRVVSDETRFSEADRDFIFDLFPSVGVFGSEQEAEIKISVLTAFFTRRFSSALVDLGIDQASIPQITPEEIREASKNGFLSEEEGIKILRQLFPEQFTRD